MGCLGNYETQERIFSFYNFRTNIVKRRHTLPFISLNWSKGMVFMSFRRKPLPLLRIKKSGKVWPVQKIGQDLDTGMDGTGMYRYTAANSKPPRYPVATWKPETLQS